MRTLICVNIKTDSPDEMERLKSDCLLHQMINNPTVGSAELKLNGKMFFDWFEKSTSPDFREGFVQELAKHIKFDL